MYELVLMTKQSLPSMTSSLLDYMFEDAAIRRKCQEWKADNYQGISS